jgi:hypothetical protein
MVIELLRPPLVRERMVADQRPRLVCRGMGGATRIVNRGSCLRVCRESDVTRLGTNLALNEIDKNKNMSDFRWRALLR